MSNPLGKMSAESLRDEPEPTRESANAPGASQHISVALPARKPLNGYLLDSSDTVLPIFTSPSSRKPSSGLNSKVVSEANGAAVPAAHRASLESGYYADDGGSIQEQANMGTGVRRATGLATFDWNAPPFALTNSTDSLSSASSISTPTSNGDAPIKSAEMNSSHSGSATSAATPSSASSPRTRPRASTQGSSPDVNYPAYVSGDVDLTFTDVSQPASLGTHPRHSLLIAHRTLGTQ